MKITSILEKSIIVAWLVIGACGIVSGAWLLDRDAPFTLGHVTVRNAAPGGYVMLSAPVKRDHRGCSLAFSRFMMDSQNVRFDISGTQRMNKEALRATEAISPDLWQVAFEVPFGAATGPAKVLTAIAYTCNPLHTVWPIDVVTEIPFVVL